MAKRTKEIVIDYPGPMLDYQREFHLSKKRYRVIIGGYGCGKTTAGVMEAIKLSLEWPNNLGLIGRADSKRLKLTTLTELENYLPRELVLEHNKHDQMITLINGSKIAYMAVSEEYDALDKIKSMNLGWFYIDQAEEVEKSIFDALRARLRRQNSSRQGFLTANARGKNWIYKVFVEKTGGISPDDIDVWIVPTYANPYLPTDYVKELETLDTPLYRRYVLCEFDDWGGQIFQANWANDVFVEETTPSIIQKAKYAVVGIDYGYRAPSACVLVLVIKEQDSDFIWVADEIYQSELVVSDLVIEIEKMVNKYNLKGVVYVIDPSTKQRSGITGSSIYEEINYHLPVIPGNNDLKISISRIQSLLNRKKLKISKNALNLQREIQNWEWEELPDIEESNWGKSFKEKPRPGDDHAIDALRYAINYIMDAGFIEIEAKAKESPKEIVEKLDFLRKKDYIRFNKRKIKRFILPENNWMI